MANGIGDITLPTGCANLFVVIDEIQAMGLPPTLGKGTLWAWLNNYGCDRFAEIRMLFFGEISEDEFCRLYPDHPACDVEPKLPGFSYAWRRWTFGDIPIGKSASATQTIVNNGEGPLALSDIRLVQVPDTLFQITSGDDDVTLQAGESHDIVITFTPTRLGYWACYLRLRSNDENYLTFSSEMRGGGSEPEPEPPEDGPPVLGYDWSSWTFGDIVAGDYSIVNQIIINDGKQPLKLWDIYIENETDVVFQILSGSRGVTLGAGESHRIEVIFRPIKAGYWGGLLWLSSNDPNWPQIGFWLNGGAY